MCKLIKLLVINLYLMKDCDSSGLRKRLDHYSYSASHNIGKGYSSYVYKGKNDLTDETVAIKVIDLKLLKGEVHRNLLASQLQTLKSCKACPHVIQLYHIYSTKNNTYIISEFCEGGDLSHMISGKRGLPESEAIEFLKQIVSGYIDIFSQRIIHRDLKPANIFLKDGKIKIGDFGFAMKHSESKKFSSYNVGSPIYMPPEALNENKYTYKSDIWAIGIIFYELLTGRTPWKAKTEKELGKQLTAIPISKLLPKNISQVSAQFLERTLCSNFQKRMNPEELSLFMNLFNSQNTSKRLFPPPRTESMNHRPFDKTGYVDRADSSLNKNTIYQPKKIRGLMFMKNENQNKSLPKTASTSQNTTETPINPIIDKKQISKQLLSQIHFCRFVFKLIQRMGIKLRGKINKELKESMCGMIFEKLEEVENLGQISCEKGREYKKTQDYQKIKQIVHQYLEKYQNTLPTVSLSQNSFDTFEQNINPQLKKLFSEVQTQDLSHVKEEIIILDYLITLKQLVVLIRKKDMEMFHGKAKMEEIVEGAPSKQITEAHVEAIKTKLKTIKIL